jgi:hypothetical protein
MGATYEPDQPHSMEGRKKMKSLQVRVNATRDVIDGYGDRIVIETLRADQSGNDLWAVWREEDAGPFKNIWLAKKIVADRLRCHVSEVRVIQ